MARRAAGQGDAGSLKINGRRRRRRRGLAKPRLVGHMSRIGPCPSARRCGREAEGGGLLNRYRVVKPYRGFESLRLRQFSRRAPDNLEPGPVARAGQASIEVMRSVVSLGRHSRETRKARFSRSAPCPGGARRKQNANQGRLIARCARTGGRQGCGRLKPSGAAGAKWGASSGLEPPFSAGDSAGAGARAGRAGDRFPA